MKPGDIFVTRVNELILEEAVDIKNKMRDAQWELTRSALRLLEYKQRIGYTINKN